VITLANASIQTMSEILANKLYLGSIDDALDVVWLKSCGITKVLTVCADSDAFSLKDILATAKLDHDVFEAYDENDEELSVLFPKLFEIIDSTPTILVHCMMGISRSVTVVLAYLMHSYKMSLEDATRLVLSKRNYIFPNDGFIMQLIKYEKKLFGMMSFLPDKYGIAKFKQMIHTFGDKDEPQNHNL
jgi:predicted protein tyrosine phosphatase